MKHIHVPTLLMHIGLLLLARLTINDHPDLFLGVGLIALSAHLICSFRSGQDYHTAHTLGMLLTLSAEYFGWVRDPQRGLRRRRLCMALLHHRPGCLLRHPQHPAHRPYDKKAVKKSLRTVGGTFCHL